MSSRRMWIMFFSIVQRYKIVGSCWELTGMNGKHIGRLLKDRITSSVYLLWRVWKARNKLMFQGEQFDELAVQLEEAAGRGWDKLICILNSKELAHKLNKNDVFSSSVCNIIANVQMLKSRFSLCSFSFGSVCSRCNILPMLALEGDM
ncbi:ribonuclease H-like superfamily protein, partial [Striga asiatica]